MKDEIKNIIINMKDNADDLSKKLEIDLDTLNKYISGNLKIKFTDLEKLLKYFGYSSNALLYKQEEPLQVSINKNKLLDEEKYIVDWAKDFILDNYEVIKLTERKYK